MSEKGIDFLMEIEGVRKKPYDDQTGKEISEYCKGATIGVGHLISNEELFERFKDGIEHSEIMELLKQDLKSFEYAVNKYVIKELPQHKFDAVVMLVFNIGVRAFSNSSVLKMINNPKAKTNYKTVEGSWKAWKKSQGKVMKGLVNRRQKEWNYYCGLSGVA